MKSYCDNKIDIWLKIYCLDLIVIVTVYYLLQMFNFLPFVLFLVIVYFRKFKCYFYILIKQKMTYRMG